MRPAIALAAVPLLAAGVAGAWPVLAGGRRTPAGACYPDHRAPSLWWLAPASPVLRESAGVPAVSFTEYRYSGTRATGDRGTFWGRGLLQFTLVFPENGPRLAQARAALGPGARVEAVLPTAVTAEVVFAPTAGDGGARSLGTTQAAAPPAGDGGPVGSWEERSFALALPPESVRLVAEAFARGAVVLSVNVAAAAPAFAMPPPAGQQQAAPPPATLTVDAVPVTLDPGRQPQAMRTLELDATMAAGYTFLEVGCSDFVAGTALADLAVVLVRVRARAVNGEEIGEELRFAAGAPEVQGVRFDRAVRLDAGYVVEVHRVSASGGVSADPPREVKVWTGFLDVSLRDAGGEERLDARLLY